MREYVKRADEKIKAVQWTGDNVEDVLKFTNDYGFYIKYPGRVLSFSGRDCEIGDYIVEDILKNYKFSPVKKTKFEAKYRKLT